VDHDPLIELSDPVPPVGPGKLLTGPAPEEEMQGKFLLGKFADNAKFGGEYISAKPTVTNGKIWVEGTALHLADAGNTPIPIGSGLEIPSWTGNSKLRIENISAILGYKLSYFDPAKNQWRDYCDPADSEWAVPMPGYWTTVREHETRTNTVTFACRISGKAAACGTWGYWPEDTPGAGPDSGYIGWDLNQACIQMAMALYCGPGDTPHTREKTPILIRDFIAGAEPNEVDFPLANQPSPPAPPPPDNYYFEAAFQPRRPVLCLNHTRWADFELGGPCDNLVPDPRVHPGEEFCEEGGLETNTVTLYVGSKTMDIQMHTWGTGAGDRTTSAHGYVQNDQYPQTTTVPPTGFIAPALSTEGYILRNLTGELVGDPNVVKVYRLHHTNGDTVLGTPNMLPNYTYDMSSSDTDFEGYWFQTASGQTQPYYLWKLGQDYVTATNRPSFLYTKQNGGAPVGHMISGPLAP
jgi:hypothetical protein